MKRRILLAAASFSLTGFAGCIGSLSEENDRETEEKSDPYEQCEDNFIHTRYLPDSAKDEAIAAMEDGVYETENELILPKVIKIDDSYLFRTTDDSIYYYQMTVESNGSMTLLRAEETSPEASSISMRNYSNNDCTFDLRIEYEGDLLIEETVDIPAQETINLDNDINYQFGSYRAEIVVHSMEGSEGREMSWEVSPGLSQAQIVIFSSGEVSYEQGDAEIRYCKWNDDGELR